MHGLFECMIMFGCSQISTEREGPGEQDRNKEMKVQWHTEVVRNGTK